MCACSCGCVRCWLAPILGSKFRPRRRLEPPLAMKPKQHIALSASCFRVSKVWAWLPQLSAIYLHTNVSLTSPATSVHHSPSSSSSSSSLLAIHDCICLVFLNVMHGRLLKSFCSLFFLGFCFQLLLFLNHKLELSTNAKCLSILQELLHALRFRESRRVRAPKREREVVFFYIVSIFSFVSFLYV